MNYPEIDPRIRDAMSRRIRPRHYFAPHTVSPLYLHITMPDAVSSGAEFFVIVKITDKESPYCIEPAHKESSRLTVGFYGTGCEMKENLKPIAIQNGATVSFYGRHIRDYFYPQMFLLVNYNREERFCGVKKAHVPVKEKKHREER